MDVLGPALSPCLPGIAALGLGWFLRQSVCNETEGETAAKFAQWITLPSLILQSFNRLPLSEFGLPIVGLYSIPLIISATIAWIRSKGLHPRERGLLSGVSLGASVSMAAIPLATFLFPGIGLRAALLCAAVNLIATHVVSYMLFSTAGAAFPESYEHLDGGKYKGEWKGMLKEGFGVYFYPGGAKYEGQWREGVKEGRGVYFFPKGGLYEGEWRAGLMSGIGVRTFASGKVQAGLWENGKLVTPMDELLCALAVEGANEAAAVARNVQVGGATWRAALRKLATQAAAWAIAAAFAMAALNVPLTPTVDTVTSRLAAAHAPLALLSVGLSLDFEPIPSRQVQEVAASLTGRLLPSLLVLLAASTAAHFLGWVPGPMLLNILGPLALCTLAPVPQTALQYAHAFRLNEALAAGLVQAGTIISLILMPFLGIVAMVSAQLDSMLPFIAAVATVMVAVTVTSILVALEQETKNISMSNRIKMVYTGKRGEGKKQKSDKAPAAMAAAAEGEGVQQTPAAAGREEEKKQDANSEEPKQQPPKKKSSFTDIGGEGGSELPPPAPAAGAVVRRRQQHVLTTRPMTRGFNGLALPRGNMRMSRQLKSTAKTVFSFHF